MRPREICKGKKKIYTLLFGHWNIHLRKGLIHLSQDEQRERHLTCKTKPADQHKAKPSDAQSEVVLFSIRVLHRGKSCLTFVKEEPAVENRAKEPPWTAVSSMTLPPRLPVPGELDLRYSHSIGLTSSGSDKSRYSYLCAKFPRTVLF